MYPVICHMFKGSFDDKSKTFQVKLSLKVTLLNSVNSFHAMDQDFFYDVILICIGVL